ncbi:hypothetical protein MKX08_008729 [Trichoderma sp. CBMAI-0020]|nr:hypothetical protein MKX08_008729 [Trichoderma sp. CBMAI-0020]
MTTCAGQQAGQGGIFSDRTVVEVARRSSPQHAARLLRLVLAARWADLQEPRGSGDPAAEESRLSGRAEDWSERQHDAAQGLRLDEREKSAVATMA